jgi:phosphomannomutase
MSLTPVETIFRAYDIRGVYGKTITEDIVHDIGAAFSTFLGTGKKICLGRDTRKSGYALLESFQKGAQETGCDVVTVGIVPIPVLGFFTWRNKYDSGVYISASHNPPDYNGIRIRGNDGAGFLDEKKKIKELYLKKEFHRGSNDESLKTGEKKYNSQRILQEYFDFITEKIQVDRKLTIVADPGNGSAYGMLPLYEKLGCTVHGINTQPNGDFPGRGPNPDGKTMSYAGEIVRNVKGDFAVGFDADADRGIILDERGMLVPPEKIAVIIAQHHRKKGNVVASMDSSMLLERELKPLGIAVIREKVGDVFMAQAVKKHKAIIGVERSGHFFLPEFQASDDPFAMSAKVIEILSQTKKKLSEFTEKIPDLTYYSEKITCPDEIKFSIMDEMKDDFQASKDTYDLNFLDGIRVSTDKWMVLIRASNTEPILRMYIETTEANVNELKMTYKDIITKVIKRYLKKR